MNRGLKIVALGVALALGGCAQLQPILASPDASLCAMQVLASGQRDVPGLLAAAKASPACVGLTDALIQAAIREAMLRVR